MGNRQSGGDSDPSRCHPTFPVLALRCSPNPAREVRGSLAGVPGNHTDRHVTAAGHLNRIVTGEPIAGMPVLRDGVRRSSRLALLLMGEEHGLVAGLVHRRSPARPVVHPRPAGLPQARFLDEDVRHERAQVLGGDHEVKVSCSYRGRPATGDRRLGVRRQGLADQTVRRPTCRHLNARRQGSR